MADLPVTIFFHNVGAQEREFGLVPKAVKIVEAKVKFMIADSQCINAHCVQAFDVRQTPEDCGHGGTLKDVAGHQNQCMRLPAAVFFTDFVDQGGHSGDAADFLTTVFAFDFKRHQIPVQIVEKQNGYGNWRRRTNVCRVSGAACHPGQQQKKP